MTATPMTGIAMIVLILAAGCGGSGGNHVMLTDLKQMPKAGGSVLARLFFRHTGEIDVDIPVVPQTYVPSSP